MLPWGTKRIGFQITQTGVRYARLNKKKTWEVDRCGHLPLEAGLISDDQTVVSDELIRKLSHWIKKERLSGSYGVLSIPASHVIIRRMNIPTKDPRELKQLVLLEVETTLHLPFEDPVFDYVKTGETETGTQVLIYAASRKLVSKYVSVFEAAGIRVKGAEFTSSALARVIASEHQQEAFADTMLISLEMPRLDISMFHGGQPMFMHSIMLYEGERDRHEQDREPNELLPGQVNEVMAEISRMLNFYQFSLHEGRARIVEAVIMGSEGGRQQLAAALHQNQPDLEVREIGFGSFFMGKHTENDPDSYRGAIGLAISEKSRPLIDLLPRTDREAQIFPYVFSVLILLWLAAVAAVSIWTMNDKSALADKTDKANQLRIQVSALEKSLASQGLGKQSGQTDVLGEVAAIRDNRQDAVAVVKQLNEKLPKGAEIRNLSYNTKEQVALTVYVADLADASRYLFDLRRVPIAASAMLQALSENSASTRNGEAGAAGESAGITEASGGYTANYTIQFRKATAKEGDSDGADQ